MEVLGKMYVIKRDGRSEEVHFDKITARIRKLCDGLDARFIDPVSSALWTRISMSTCCLPGINNTRRATRSV